MKEQQLCNYINGQLAGDEFIPIQSYNGITFCQVARSSSDAVAAALEANHQALSKPLGREELFQAALTVADGLNRNFREIATIMCLESGYPIRDAEGLLAASRDFLLSFDGYLPDALKQEAAALGTSIPLSYADRALQRETSFRAWPKGVILAITPANAPLPLILLNAFSALAAGSRITVIPSSRSAAVALTTAQLFMRTSLPQGAVNIINTETARTLQVMLESELVDCVYYTGSSKYAGQVMQAALSGGSDVMIELEGNGLAIVDDVQLSDTLVSTLAAAITRCNGQLCTSLNGLLVHRSIYEPLKEALVEVLRNMSMGDPLCRTTDVGPLFSEPQAVYIKSQIEEAKAAGARVLVGGEQDGKWLAPTLIDNVTLDMSLFRDETFGPVAWIQSYNHDNELRSWLDKNRYGLNLTIFSDKPEELMAKVFTKARVTRLCVNGDPTIQSPFSPWGASRKSGLSPVASYIGKYRQMTIIDSEHRITSGGNWALVLDKPGKLIGRTFPLEEAGDHLCIEMRFSGICGTDKQAFLGQFEVPYPIVLGHENVGIIHHTPDGLVDAQGTPLHKGDVVTWPAIVPCGRCFSCHLGADNLCVSHRAFGLSYPATVTPFVFGGWSRFCYLPRTTLLIKLPPEAANDPAFVLIEQLATGIAVKRALTELIGSLHDSNIIVIGSGSLALLTAFTAKRIMGVKRVVLCGYEGQAQLLGAILDGIVQPIRGDISRAGLALRALESTVGADIVIDAAGFGQGFQDALLVVRPGGVVVELGNLAKTEAVIDIGKITMNNLTIKGLLAYTLKDFIEAGQAITQHKMEVAGLITQVFDLTAYEDAVAAWSNKGCGKIVFSCSGNKSFAGV